MSSSNTDFDATLLDWLYGELDSEAAASFEAHLETHPEHKAEALALRETRMAFQQLPQAEPSSALTAVLMQQAAASAQPKQGMWASIVGFFQPVMLHPAAAAMATVVLLAGVAGTLYLRNGDMVAEPTVASSKAERTSGAQPGAAPPVAAVEPDLGVDQTLARDEESEQDGNGSENGAKNDNSRALAADLASPAQEERLRSALAREGGEQEQPRKPRNATKSRAGKGQGDDGFAFDSTSNAISGGAIADSKAKLSDKTHKREAPAKKNRSSSRGLVGGSTPETATVAPSPVVTATKAPPSWETKNVQDFQIAARGKRCREAGRIANDLKEKSPQVYKQSVEGSPEESNCSSYIASETKRRKMARSKRAARKSKQKARKGQGKSVPRKAVAAPQESFDETAEGL